jgi:2-polyprenyl-3-methyl-5-hydroxy-6-metoxy-1,4-benzoquinol methylase
MEPSFTDKRAFCPICGQQTNNLVFTTANNFNLYRCQKCRHVFVFPLPTAQDLSLAYENFPFLTEKLSPTRAKSITKDLYKIIKKFNKNTNLIVEIGSSTGYILFGFKERGYQVVGSDFSAAAADLAKEYYAVPVYSGEFPPEEFLGKADVVILHHVVEHVLDPVSFLEKAAAFLRNNGLLVVAVPNLNSIGFKFFKYNYPVVSPPFHLHYFNKKSLLAAFSPKLKILQVKNTSYVVGRNPFCYNALVAMKSLLTKKAAVYTVENQAHAPKKNQAAVRRLVRVVLQLLSAPFFYIFDKLNLGENIIVVCKK